MVCQQGILAAFKVKMVILVCFREHELWYCRRQGLIFFWFKSFCLLIYAMLCCEQIPSARIYLAS